MHRQTVADTERINSSRRYRLSAYSVAERKTILDAGETHPDYTALMRAYANHQARENERIREDY